MEGWSKIPLFAYVINIWMDPYTTASKPSCAKQWRAGAKETQEEQARIVRADCLIKKTCWTLTSLRVY